jgi:hypothetical protein
MRPFTSSLKAGASVPTPIFCPKEKAPPNRRTNNMDTLFIILSFKKFILMNKGIIFPPLNLNGRQNHLSNF